MADKAKDIKTTFRTTVNARLTLHPNQWAGEDSSAVVEELLVNLKDNEGNPITLTDEEKDLVQLATRPTQEVQLRLLKTIAAAHNVTVDATTEGLIKKVVSATAFKIDLVKAGKITDAGSNRLKDLLG